MGRRRTAQELLGRFMSRKQAGPTVYQAAHHSVHDTVNPEPVLEFIREKDSRLRECKDFAITLLQKAITLPTISNERLLGWIDWLNECHPYSHEVERLATRYIQIREPIPPSVIMKWAKRSVSRRSFKPAALLLINANCMSGKVLPTSVLCDWLEESVEYYDGDHGFLRFLRLLLERLDRGRVPKRLHPRIEDALRTVLVHLSRNRFEFDLCADTMKVWLPAETWNRIRDSAYAQIATAYEEHLEELHEHLHKPATET